MKINKNLEKQYAKVLKLKKENLRKSLDLEKEERKHKRKERTHQLILKGTVFERLDLMNASEEYLIGLVISAEPFTKDDNEVEKLEALGKKYLEMRRSLEAKR